MKKNRYATITAIEHNPSNIIEITLMMQSNFNFVAGQYITVTLPNLKHLPYREQFRDFSISSPPEQLPTVKVTYRQSNSLFKQTLTAMPLGSRLEVDGPAGNLTLPLDSTPLILIAGGIGITPFISMLQSNHSHSTITLLHFNQSPQTAPQFSFLSNLPRLTYIRYFKRPSANLLHPYIGNPNDQRWFIAGPPAMVNRVMKCLKVQGVNLAQIKSEEFSGYEEED